MPSAKDLILRPISRAAADALVKRVHYSGKVVSNSQFHIGAYLNGQLEGVMQFGPSLDKRKLVGLVEGTAWNNFIELNRMAFTDALPRNSESRALAVAMRILRQHAAKLQWVVTFADAAQCGDGTIYRASGFVLTSIKANNQIWEFPTGERFSRASLTGHSCKRQQVAARLISRAATSSGAAVMETGAATMRPFIAGGARPIPGYQLRYIYFLDPTARQRLTVPVLPFSAIGRAGAGMYRGQSRAGSIEDATADQAGEGGSQPTPALHA